MKKIIRLFLVIISLFVIFLFIYLTPKDYDLEYVVNGVEIEEEYNKKEKYYEITFEYRNNEYKYISFDDYNKKRKIINKINIIEEDNYMCLIAFSDVISIYPLCEKDGKNVDYHLIDELEENILSKYHKNVESIKEKYKNININYLDDKTYLIWNYTGFDIINRNGNKSIELFEKDIYDIPLVFLLNDNLVIPDYEKDYYFEKYYIYNLEKDKLSDWDLKYPI